MSNQSKSKLPTLIGTMEHRDPTEAHRVSTPLELFFDLVFVVAIAFASSALHHDLVESHFHHGIQSYVMVFFAIWWAWMNFTWFASAYDIDDIPYRLLVCVQMVGALILAAGVPRAFDESDFRVVAVGYMVMRLALVVQWLRVARQDPDHRSSALRYALGISLVQIGWMVWIFLISNGSIVWFLTLVFLELMVPVWAENPGHTTWHPEHITERYGLFTIIVLGESVLAASIAIQTFGDLEDINWQSASIIAGGILTLFSVFWIYFGFRDELTEISARRTFLWGYGHYFIWAAIAAVGVGISLAIDFETGASTLSILDTGLGLAIPVTVFLVSMWFFHDIPRPLSLLEKALMPVAAVLVLLVAPMELSTLAIGGVTALLAAARTWVARGSD